MYRCLHCAAASDSIYATLAAAYRTRDLAKACSCTTIVAGWVGKLWGVAQLEGLNSGFHSRFSEEIEVLEQRKVVLNIPRPAELVSTCITQPNVLSSA